MSDDAFRGALEAYSAFGQTHGLTGFGFRKKDYPNCAVFVFKPERISAKWDEYTALKFAVRTQWRISPDAFMTEDAEYIAAGIYIAWNAGPIWMIPDTFRETQAFVRERLPVWAEEWTRR